MMAIAMARRPRAPASRYAFPLPEPGSYALPPIKAAGDGQVRGEDGRPHDLGDLVRGQITILSFIYTRCADICPLATLRLMDLHDAAGRAPDVASQLRLLSLSFDPEHDSPAVMAEYAEGWRGRKGSGPEWLFLIPSRARALETILDAYGQAVARKPDPTDPMGPLSHVLRAFLIDRNGMIRNIYSVDYLDPDLMLVDVRTLLMEEQGREDRSGLSEKAR
jgi:protein SCO1